MPDDKPSERLSVGVSCPACGGALSIEEGESVVNCQYCGSMLFIEGDQGVQTVAFKNRMDPQRVMQAAESWWRKGLKARDLKRTGKVTENYPIYLPFWSTTTKVAGWVCGYEEHTRSDGKGHTYTERVPKEVMVLQDQRYSQIACDPGDLGIRSLRNFTGERTLENFTMIPTYETTTSVDDARKVAETEAVELARRGAGVPHITFERIYAIPRKMSVIYYPIWVVRYSYRDRMYVVTVDGVTGQVLSGRAPGDPLFQSLAITGGSAAAGLISGFGLVGAAMAGGENSAFLALGGLAVGLAILFFTYRFFRTGSEIVEGEFAGKRGMVQSGNPLDIGEVLKAIQGMRP
ncbi:MAG TPA: hypothetical protein VLU38_06705 [Methanomassiliicoccales archaeon]|nr:hypothetical protein [Methanomassiliicoccales archaeon]